MAIGEKTKTGGACSTFTVAGVVKRALMEADFTLEKLPGCGGNNHVLHGIKG
jgi:tRNA 5-methylaminomethyl-2-thiouridine biosynthesis bifunctional protein